LSWAADWSAARVLSSIIRIILAVENGSSPTGGSFAEVAFSL
jgi:hypothetical protein